LKSDQFYFEQQFYPLRGCSQVEKAKRSEQHVAVCVLEVHGVSDADVPARQYLIVQRPKQGLLAGERSYVTLSIQEDAKVQSLPLLWKQWRGPPRSSSAHDVGLWEFPATTVPEGTSDKMRRSAIDGLLSRLLERGPSGLPVKERRQLGSIVHIFSHIRMTLHVEKLVLQVYSILQ
jgi:A/G-specific adenine glycosylase